MLRDPDYPTQTWALHPSNPDKPKWVKATLTEIKTLLDAGAIVPIPITEVPPDATILRSLLVYRRKRDEEGRPIKDKARLVIDGSSAPDEGPTFSPTCMMSTIKLLCAAAVHNKVIQHQVDITAAYVQAPIHNDAVYIHLPRSIHKAYDENGQPLVLHIKRSLYGHPQSVHHSALQTFSSPLRRPG